MRGRITAIVPTYNRAAFLAEAVAALQAQTRPPEEIIVWDDGSTDSTPETAAALARQGPVPLRLFRGENAGKAAALNRALAEARGDYVWICDDDDLARPDAAERLAGLLDADPAAGVAGGGYMRFSDLPDGTRVRRGPGYWPDLSRGSPLRHLLEDIFLFQNATLARRSCYAAVGPFREDLPRSLDYDMIVRLAARFPVRMTEATLFDQRKHQGARGPAAARHAAARSEAVWAEHDRRVFADLRPLLPLSLYEAMWTGGDPALRARAARLQRACVYARRNDWPAALEDLEAAADLEAGPPTAPEIAVCRRAMAGKYAPALRPEEPAARRLFALRRRSAAGRAAAGALARGLLWRLRAAATKGELRETARLARLIAGLGGPARESGAAPARGEPLRERDVLPAEAYAWPAPPPPAAAALSVSGLKSGRA